MTFLTINSEEQDSELTIKSLEQQRFELEKFEELKQCYNFAVNYIKENEIPEATNVLLNLFDNELFTFKSFDAKQLQKAVMKLLLSLKTASSDRQLSICLRGLEMFPDEKGFWERCGDLLIESEKFSEAVEIYNYLFKSDPFSPAYLQNYVDCLKKSFKFDELENLKRKLEEIGWLKEDQINLFDWRSDFPLLAVFNVENDGPKSLETILIPFRDLNWTNYASTLHAMATGNYTKIFKKQPFNPENYSILNGPCLFELQAQGVVNPQQNTQNLINSLHDYSASSMDDISKKRSLRRKETRTTQSITAKTDLTPADLVKMIKSLLNFDEQEIVDILCSTERSCLQLLDKNNLVIDDEAIQTGNYYFTIESLHQRINSDNEIKKSISHRIFELVTFFFVDSLKISTHFPQSLAKPMADLWQLFKSGAFSVETLKEITQFNELLTSVCEILISLNPEIKAKAFSYEFALLKHQNSIPSQTLNYRSRLLESLIKENEEIRENKLEELAQELHNENISFINTRHFNPLPDLITSETLNQAISTIKKSKIIDKAEELFSQDKQIEAIELFGSLENLNNLIKISSGEMKLRLAKLSETSCDSIIPELLAIYPQLEISKFIEYLTVFLPSSQLSNTQKCTFLCIFWNIYSRKQLIINHILLNALFALLLEKIIPANLDICRFVLNWMSQEKCFGSASGLVPLKVFSQFAASTDFSEIKFAYSVIFSLFRFPNIFAAMDPERGLEEWDRSPIGIGARDIPCPNLNESEFNNLALLIHRIDEMIETIEDPSKVVISEPGFVSFVDWLKKQFSELAETQNGKHFFYCLNLNRNHLRAFLNSTLELHAQKLVLLPPRGHFTLDNTESFRYLLNTRSDTVYSELQGRKKSFDILKTIRSDLKTSLSLDVSDGEVWKLLGLAYHDAAIHFMSSDAEFLIQNSAKLKRCIKKAILCLKQALKIDQNDREAWTKLMDLIDWSLHEPSLLSSDQEIVKFLCSIGCSCIQQLLPGAVARDRWILFLRLELFLRKSGNLIDPLKQLELLKEASQAACIAYSENVYESTALFMSLVKFYSRLSKLRLKGVLSEEHVSSFIFDLNLPTCIQIDTPAESGDLLLYQQLEALNVLDRKKIFHSHVAALAWHSARLLNDPQCALNILQQLFPFLKSNKKSAAVSLLQIYQCDHERPARFLVAGKRYLLQLLEFIEQVNLNDFDKPEFLTQFLKKLHYIRKTILGFPEILIKATLIYLNLPQPDKEIVVELVGSIKTVFNNKIPNEIKLKLIEQ